MIGHEKLIGGIEMNMAIIMDLSPLNVDYSVDAGKKEGYKGGGGSVEDEGSAGTLEAVKGEDEKLSKWGLE